MPGRRPTPRARRASERGFTLLELLVASVAGLFVVLAAFLLSRGATRLFAAEGRVATTQLSLRIGVDRLRGDLERAGFMATANVRDDPDVCPNPNTTYAFPARLQAIHYQPGAGGSGAVDAPISASLNNLHPDRITLLGNFTSTDSYLAADISIGSSGGYRITLQSNFASTARLLSVGDGGGTSVNKAIEAIFAPGRMVRIRNDLGSSQFLQINTAAIGAGGRVEINTAGNPPYTVVTGGTATPRCGGRGTGMGYEISPVQLVQYSVRSLASKSGFGWAYPDAGGLGDQHKYDLVRTELYPNGSEIANTQEIVAEYAVDLAFAFSVDTTPPIVGGAAWQEPVVQSFPFGHADNAAWAGDIITNPTARPQRIRSVKYRLTTRNRFPEYDAPGELEAGPGPMRYKLATDRYARARTVIGEVSLPNQQGIRW